MKCCFCKDNFANVINKDEVMDKINELVNLTQGKLNTGLALIKKEEPKKAAPKKGCKCKKILIIAGIVVVLCAIGYAVYKYLNPDYIDDFEDDEEEIETEE